MGTVKGRQKKEEKGREEGKNVSGGKGEEEMKGQNNAKVRN